MRYALFGRELSEILYTGFTWKSYMMSFLRRGLRVVYEEQMKTEQAQAQQPLQKRNNTISCIFLRLLSTFCPPLEAFEH